MIDFKPNDVLTYQATSYSTWRVTFIRYVREWGSVDNKRWALVKRPHRKTPVRVEARKLSIYTQ